MNKTNKEKILIVDDDYNLCQLIKSYLVQENFEVAIADNGQAALEKFKEFAPHLVLLDIMLPQLDGWNVCKEIRRVSNIPIVMLTARGEQFDKVLGLELGADDYIVKPFDFRELIARIRAVLRRYAPKGVEVKQIVYPNLMIDINEYHVRLNGEHLKLKPKELELLYFLASHPNQVFTRQQLLEEVWGFDFSGSTRTIDVHVDRLRKKVHDDKEIWQIKTLWGVGYKFEVKKQYV
ncbi:response regulator transcription factor [Tepidibacillus sp. HK-1]|uniref:response regulator transcription factor n=1 Tax=Tepidibacillus sp. HK-1 TaxID=1883407 RepID=UPI000852D40D|nr:response regulator transcription factor [Tepidibacillus sp. HK-1]GBF10892.1 transcriptional regulatory protein SrrA [Tepidibacillus sp. HK-1]